MSDEMRTYLIEKRGGEKLKVTVPDAWKVTFGPAVVASSTASKYLPMALRFYETDKKQRAIFTDVISFRDMSIKVEKEKIEVAEKDGFTECEGVRQRSTFQVRTKRWVNPDENPEDLPKIDNKDIHATIAEAEFEDVDD